MKSIGSLVLKSLLFVAIVSLNLFNVQTQGARQPVAQVDEKTAGRTRNLPQEFVVCTGWHALCTASYDCRVKGDGTADCDCMRVNEPYIVETSNIQDTALKRLTQAECTNKHPCDVDQAPVCEAIQNGRYEVKNVKYDWVSTFSYRGWCDLLQVEIQPCDPRPSDYTGDRYWAVCDGAPCTENGNPLDPNRPLTCQCRVEDGPFLGTNGSCTGDNGGIMSSSPLWTWDFANNTYRIPIPGLEFVQGACAPLKSDPLSPRQSSNPYR